MRGHATPVVVPYTRLDDRVVDALTQHDVTFWDVSGSDDAYWRLLRRMWSRGDTFIVIEQDVVVRPDSLDALLECPEPWCSFQVPYVGKLYAGLSCAKFSAGLIARHPDALERIASIEDEDHTPRHWCRLDSHLQSHVLNPGGEIVHVHGPPLEHLRDGSEPESPWEIGPVHGCWR